MANQRQAINSYDIDGVITVGITPRPEDIIITGRSYQEAKPTYKQLRELGIDNPVYFQPMNWENTSRESSGRWKGQLLKQFQDNGVLISKHFEDDEIQKAEIEKLVNTPVVLLEHNLTNKEKQDMLN